MGEQEENVAHTQNWEFDAQVASLPTSEGKKNISEYWYLQ
jgi:hypothetical protein